MSVPGRKARSVKGFAAAGVAVALLGSMAAASDDVVVDTPSRVALRELGRRLFFDPAASSRTGMRACADCHLPEHGFADPEKRSADDTALTQRHSQTLVDAGDSPTAHWDGEFKSMHELVVGRLNVQFDSQGGAHYGGNGNGRFVAMRPRNLRTGGGASFDDADALSAIQVDHREGSPVVPAALAALLPSAAHVGPSSLPNGVDVVLSDDAMLAFELSTGVKSKTLRSFLAANALAPARGPDDFAPFVNLSLASSLPTAPASITQAGRYREAFAAAFEKKLARQEINEKRIAEAIAEFCHSIRSGESPYDRHVAGEDDALSASAKRGLALFEGKAGCATCHVLAGERAAFTDYRFHDTGVVWRSTGSSVRAGADMGRHVRSRLPTDVRAFKTPTLRDVARSAPYMHDGSLATLEDVVRHYASPPRDPNLDEAFPRFAPTDEEVADLVAFLRSLTSDVRPGLATTAWTARVPVTRLRFADADGQALAGLRVVVEPAGDALPASQGTPSEARTMTTDPEGYLSFEPFATTHARLVLPGGVRPTGGDLIPDTCASATVTVPVAGTARVCVLDRSGRTPPKSLVVRHPDAERFPGRRVPESKLRLVSVDETRGVAAAVYEAACRTDVGGAGTLEWPLPDGTKLTTSIDLVEGRLSIVTLP